MFNLQCNFHYKSSLQMQLYFYISTGNAARCTSVMFFFFLKHIYKSYLNVLIDLRLNPGLI